MHLLHRMFVNLAWAGLCCLYQGCDAVDGPAQESGNGSYAPRFPQPNNNFIFLREEAIQCADLTNCIKVFKHEPTGLEFVLVPAGRFRMGSPVDEVGRYDFEGPQRDVSIKSFLLSRTEVSNFVYRKYKTGHDSLGYNGNDLNGGSQPAVNLSWEEASNWCADLSLRLPSEAEWEYACRGGTTTSRYWGEGEENAEQFANVADRAVQRSFPGFPFFDIEDGHLVSAPVGSYKHNPFGLFDMIGNVSEYVQDTWHCDYSDAPIDGKPWIGSSTRRVFRGGSWHCGPRLCRSAARNSVDSSYGPDTGFRPAADYSVTDCP